MSFDIPGRMPKSVKHAEFVLPIMKYFVSKHLPTNLQVIANRIEKVAFYMAKSLPDGPEKTAGLRKLLEAKDCFIRANLEVK